MDTHIIFTQALKIFLIIDPIGMFPAIIQYFYKIKDTKKRRSCFFKEMFLAFIAAIATFVTGSQFLKLLNIGISSLKIAGGLILIKIGMNMTTYLVYGNQNSDTTPNPAMKYSPIFPVTTPLIIGPGTISKMLIIKETSPFIEAVLACSFGVISSIVTLIILFFLHHKIPHSIMISSKYVAGILTVLFGTSILVSAFVAFKM